MMSVKQVRFTDEDRECLSNYFRLADTIADLIGPYCEVVIHSFESLENSVVKIVNGHHTGREIGSANHRFGLAYVEHIRENGRSLSEELFHQCCRWLATEIDNVHFGWPRAKADWHAVHQHELIFPIPRNRQDADATVSRIANFGE